MILASALGCSHAKKHDTIVLSELEGKKVALLSVDGEPTAQSTVEVALINQLSKRGSFYLVSKQDVEAARAAPEQNPMDWVGIAKRAGADYGLKIGVKKFQADIHKGYSKEEVEDSELKAEQGGDGKTTHLYKVQALDGEVALHFDLASTGDGAIKTGDGHATGHEESGKPDSPPHLPPKLRFLEGLTNQAMDEFFEKAL